MEDTFISHEILSWCENSLCEHFSCLDISWNGDKMKYILSTFDPKHLVKFYDYGSWKSHFETILMKNNQSIVNLYK